MVRSICPSGPPVARDMRPRARRLGWGCAENCLKAILLHHGIRTGVVEVAELMSVDPERGASFADLVRAAEAKGLRVDPQALSVDELEGALVSGRGPCIVHLSWGGGHFSVADMVDGQVRLTDPPYRVWRNGLECLRESYSGHALFFEPAGSVAADEGEAARSAGPGEIVPQESDTESRSGLRAKKAKGTRKVRTRKKAKGK